MDDEPTFDDLADAVDLIRFGMEFAYEHGMHEFGYDPVELVCDRLESLHAELEQPRRALSFPDADALVAVKDPSPATQ